MGTTHDLIAVVSGVMYLLLWAHAYDEFPTEFFVVIKSMPALVLSQVG